MTHNKDKMKKENADLRCMKTALKKVIEDRYVPGCEHEFVHVVNKCWIGSEVVIYCKNCGCSIVR